MRVLAMLFMITAVPAAAAAQGASDSTTSSADVRASTSATIEIQSLRREARDSQVPEQAVANVIAEGRAKGATNAQLLAAGHATIQQLAAARQAIISAGRAHPSDAEIQQAATLMAQGGSQLGAGVSDANLAGSALRAGAEASSASSLSATGAVAGSATSAGMGSGGMIDASGQLAGSLTGEIR